jgi:molybdopterin molybdotransferase
MLHTEDVCNRPGLRDIEAARKLALDVVEPVAGRETISARASVGRVAFASIASTVPLPPFDQSAVDGYGIHVDDVRDAKTGPFRLAGKVVAGSRQAPVVLAAGEVVRLLTGAATTKDIGAVVMEEKATELSQSITIGKPADEGLNIRRAGEDVALRTDIIDLGTVIDARHVAILAASGTTHVAVRRRVKVALLSTGDELARAGGARQTHQIYDSNGPMLQALFSSPAIHMRMLGCCPDHPRRLMRQMARAARAFDLLISSGGVSGSDADHVVAAVLEAGGSCEKISLALKPGKPLAIGRIGAMAVLALPGNPVAALVGALLFARPMLQRLAGQSMHLYAPMMAKAAKTFSHRLGRTEFVPVRIVGHDGEGTPLLEKLGRGGSARLRPLVLADGLGCIPQECDDLPAGTPLRYFPFRTAFGL